MLPLCMQISLLHLVVTITLILHSLRAVDLKIKSHFDSVENKLVTTQAHYKTIHDILAKDSVTTSLWCRLHTRAYLLFRGSYLGSKTHEMNDLLL